MNILKRLSRQAYFWWRADHAASWMRKAWLGWRYDCYVSLRANVYCADRIELGRNVQIHGRVVLNYRSGFGKQRPNLVIGEGTKIMPDAKLIPQQGFIRIGKNCTIQYNCLLYGVGGLEIGDDTRIAAYSVMTPMNHVYADPDIPIRLQGETALGVKIGRDVWIGTSVKVLDGVEIGDGCVIGAGSVVTKSLPPYSVAVGAPARVLRSRKAADPQPTAQGSVDPRLVEAASTWHEFVE